MKESSRKFSGVVQTTGTLSVSSQSKGSTPNDGHLQSNNVSFSTCAKMEGLK